eukprot:885317-Pelagomonas_calceolata.AAC.3
MAASSSASSAASRPRAANLASAVRENADTVACKDQEVHVCVWTRWLGWRRGTWTCSDACKYASLLHAATRALANWNPSTGVVPVSLVVGSSKTKRPPFSSLTAASSALSSSCRLACCSARLNARASTRRTSGGGAAQRGASMCTEGPSGAAASTSAAMSAAVRGPGAEEVEAALLLLGAAAAAEAEAAGRPALVLACWEASSCCMCV